MIRAEQITIHEFRGIRELTINLNQENFSICGRNGTGKSGIVDALEFALTGNISRLAGEGRGAISLKDHAPHVDSRNDPEKAKVILTVFIPHLNKKVIIERSVKQPAFPKINPADKDVLETLQKVSRHPEFVLSRRELIKYVISTPGDRAKEVQILLQLKDVEDLRGIFLKISNACKRDLPVLEREKEESKQQLLRALEITEFTQLKLLDAVNQRRKILGLGPITVLNSATSLKDGLVAELPTAQTRHIPKIQALADIQKLHDIFASITSETENSTYTTIIKELESLKNDPGAKDGMAREHFLKSAVSLIDSEACPLCDTPWEVVDLKELINTKLKHFEILSKKLNGIEISLRPLKLILEELRHNLGVVSGYGNLLKPPIDTKNLNDYRININLKSKDLDSFIPVTKTIEALQECIQIPNEVLETIAKIEKMLLAIPNPTAQDGARDYLTICQERLDTYKAISLRHKRVSERAELTAKIYKTYTDVSTKFLEDIYQKVEKDFSDLYRFINREDESGFTAQLTPSIGKLGFNVDFYGRGFFPPGAYHSEGHQDSMGLCLYLALMKHLLGKSFTFAVLDDVLMSVDSGHRREVCTLLKEKFPETQFIFTTHDEIWLKHMKTVGLIKPKAFMHFRKWDVDHGPTEWDERDVWEEINLELKRNDVRAAAALLRNYLEFISKEICHRIRALVEFHGDAQFQLGELLPPATARFKKLLTEGEKAARTWGQTDKAQAIKERMEKFNALVSQSNIEQWQINSAVHFNEWATLETGDFQPVAESFHQLISSFFCENPDCRSLFYVLPDRGQREELRCACGTLNINFREKT